VVLAIHTTATSPITRIHDHRTPTPLPRRKQVIGALHAMSYSIV
jgi:hypothetical protein